MIIFFKNKSNNTIAVKVNKDWDKNSIPTLEWLFEGKVITNGGRFSQTVKGEFIGPRKEMITPWSTAAVEITQNMNISNIERIEEFISISTKKKKSSDDLYDKMLQRLYKGLDQSIFEVNAKPQPLIYISDIKKYNKKEGLALNEDEIGYLENLSKKIGRKLTDSEVFGFSQVNSEHCRHKIFGGTFIIDGKKMPESLFEMIKKTSKKNHNFIVSAYKDNCAFLEGEKITLFYPNSGDKPDFFITKEKECIISLKAETHNFPTTVEPFNGAATGTGGEIRDRMAGGRGSYPIAGTAVYITSYPRNKEKKNAPYLDQQERKWLYHTPQEILTKASNGASDFGNKFGQSIICGSLLTFEHTQNTDTEKDNPKFGYDKVIMLAGGVGYAKKDNGQKNEPKNGDKIVLIGGDNYRIGMGGGAVSSVNTGEYKNDIELNAIQRANAEMQKRGYNAIRSLAEQDNNPIISIHDHGAGGHLNCLSELVESTGGEIDISKLPIGDPTLSLKEIIGNESQERMGLAIGKKDVSQAKKIAQRERAPFYEIGHATDNKRFTLKDKKNNKVAIDLKLEDFFGNTPKTILQDTTNEYRFTSPKISDKKFEQYLQYVLGLESVACKDWLTNKVDRSVTGLIANQQCCGEIQLPLNDVGVTAIGYNNNSGIATSIGHAPIAGLIDSAIGSRLSIAEALTNIIFAPLTHGIKGISLSANWMWPSKNKGENARLYKAVKAASKFAIELGINIPTGKDSLSMTQSYPNGENILAPGTVIISTIALCKDIRNIIHPNLQHKKSKIIYIPFSKEDAHLGGSALYQSLGYVGDKAPDITDSSYFKRCFSFVQSLIDKGAVLAGHDISAGGLITTLLEMCFANTKGGIKISCKSDDYTSFFFNEKPGVVLQIESAKLNFVDQLIKSKFKGVEYIILGEYSQQRYIDIKNFLKIDINKTRDEWYKPSFLMEKRQTSLHCATERYKNYSWQPIQYKFPKSFDGNIRLLPHHKEDNKRPIAAIIREKGSNGDREMAWALHISGFKVKDVHMTDLVSGRENLKDVQMIVFVGGFSNADTLGSAKGWAGAFLFNQKAQKALNEFYEREDTLSLGICNGCQLMAHLGLTTPKNKALSPKMLHNQSGKFESSFVGVEIPKSNSILLSSLQGSKLGIWVAHGEGRFSFDKKESTTDKNGIDIAMKYQYNAYPANPNGSPDGIAGVCSKDGRHLAIMPHPERCIRPWNWAYYPQDIKNQKFSPWIEMFINGYNWCKKHKK